MRPEQRRFPRVTESCEVRYRVKGDIVAAWVGSTTINISAGGMRIRSPEGMEPGASLELRMKLPGMPELEIHGRVIWRSLQASGVMEYGVEFAGVTLPQQAQIDRLVAFLRQRV